MKRLLQIGFIGLSLLILSACAHKNYGSSYSHSTPQYSFSISSGTYYPGYYTYRYHSYPRWGYYSHRPFYKHHSYKNHFYFHNEKRKYKGKHKGFNHYKKHNAKGLHHNKHSSHKRGHKKGHKRH